MNAETIREGRARLRLSQSELARLMDTPIRTIHAWELGTRRPSGAARTLLRIVFSDRPPLCAACRALMTHGARED